MIIKRRKPIDSKPERNLVTGLIVNDEFCKTIIPILKTYPNILAVPYTNTIVNWITSYWKQYGQKAPLRYVQKIFDEKKDALEEGNAELIKEFLTNLSLEYVEGGTAFNPEYEIDKIIQYLRKRQIKQHQDAISKAASPEDAEKLIREFSLLTLANDSGESESEGITSKELDETDILNVKWLVDGFIPAVGLMLFAAKPKTGKSSLIFNVALDVALGREVFNKIPVEEPAEVLYLALEDFSPRTKTRQKDILGRDDPPENCTIFLQGKWPKIGSGGLRKLEKWMADHPKTKLIIIDTLQKIRDSRQKEAGKSYREDYQALESLQEFAGYHEVAMIVVHHSRKTKADDVFDEISGTTGLAAAADHLAVMGRVPGQPQDRVFHTRGRDFADKQIVFGLVSDYRWELKGDASEFLGSKQRRIIVDYLKMVNIPVQRKELIEKTQNKIGKGGDILIKKLVNEGRIEKVEYGIYARRGFKKIIRLDKVAEQMRRNLNDSRVNKNL